MFQFNIVYLAIALTIAKATIYMRTALLDNFMNSVNESMRSMNLRWPIYKRILTITLMVWKMHGYRSKNPEFKA